MRSFAGDPVLVDLAAKAGMAIRDGRATWRTAEGLRRLGGENTVVRTRETTTATVITHFETTIAPGVAYVRDDDETGTAVMLRIRGSTPPHTAIAALTGAPARALVDDPRLEGMTIACAERRGDDLIATLHLPPEGRGDGEGTAP